MHCRTKKTKTKRVAFLATIKSARWTHKQKSEKKIKRNLKKKKKNRSKKDAV